MININSTGAWVSSRWWYQEEIKLGGARDRETVASDGEEDKCGEETAQEDTMVRS